MTFETKNRNIDYKKIYLNANEILVTSSVINFFPFKVSDFILEQSDIKLCKYSVALNKYGISLESFGSNSAIIQEYNGMYIIFYNQDEVYYRVRFSIIHEFAHYILNHEMNLQKENSLYKKQEVEANFFAAQILMPEQILRKASMLGYNITPDYIEKSFDVSREAAEKRKETISKTKNEWRSSFEKNYDDLILSKFQLFINHIAPRKYDYYDFEEEYRKQNERELFLDTRTRR